MMITELIYQKYKNVCPDYDVKFTNKSFSTEELNLVYNVVDVTINMASNEGFGLTLVNQ